jgi:hypothetical protein
VATRLWDRGGLGKLAEPRVSWSEVGVNYTKLVQCVEKGEKRGETVVGQFSVLGSQFSVLGSQFSVPRSSFFVDRSSWIVACGSS